MCQSRFRRWISIFAVAVMALGAAGQVHAVAAMNATMVVAMATGGMMPIPGGCDGCGDTGMTTYSSCASLCAAAVPAVAPADDPVVPTRPLLVALPDQLIVSGLSSRPDPYPPRSAVVD